MGVVIRVLWAVALLALALFWADFWHVMLNRSFAHSLPATSRFVHALGLGGPFLVGSGIVAAIVWAITRRPNAAMSTWTILLFAGLTLLSIGGAQLLSKAGTASGTTPSSETTQHETQPPEVSWSEIQSLDPVPPPPSSAEVSPSVAMPTGTALSVPPSLDENSPGVSEAPGTENAPPIDDPWSNPLPASGLRPATLDASRLKIFDVRQPPSAYYSPETFEIAVSNAGTATVKELVVGTDGNRRVPVRVTSTVTTGSRNFWCFLSPAILSRSQGNSALRQRAGARECALVGGPTPRQRATQPRWTTYRSQLQRVRRITSKWQRCQIDRLGDSHG